MEQIESPFIRWMDLSYAPYTYEPLPIPGMRTYPATRPRLARLFKTIGMWFTEKGEEWDERHVWVQPVPKFRKQIRFGDYPE